MKRTPFIERKNSTYLLDQIELIVIKNQILVYILGYWTLSGVPHSSALQAFLNVHDMI